MSIVFDLDNTLACAKHRQGLLAQEPKDWDGFNSLCHKDPPHPHTVQVFRALRQARGGVGHSIEIWSGRNKGPDNVWQYMTMKWLMRHVDTFVRMAGGEACFTHYDEVLVRMRGYKDHRDDVALKRAWLQDAIARGAPPHLVFDDRDRVVQMWRDEGVSCFQVQPGAF